MMEERPKKLKWIQFVKRGGGGSLNEKIVSSNLVSMPTISLGGTSKHILFLFGP